MQGTVAPAAPRIWIASLRIMGLFRTGADGRPLVSDWDFVSGHIEGIKFWDSQIDGKSDDELRAVFAECRRRGLRIAYEKGRWPLPEDLFGLELSKQLERQPSEAEALDHIRRDRGPMLTAFETDVWARAAATSEIARLKRISDAGGIDMMSFIDLDGAVLKNVFPYAFALTQWGLTDAPEEKRFQHGFADPATFIAAFRRMAEIIRAEVPEARHVMYRVLPNVHFWTYREAVRPERLEDGRMVYRNVDFHRFREHTLDFADVLPLIAANRDIFAGVTTDYPFELYSRPAGNARYRGIAADTMRAGLSFCPILTAMSAKDSMADWSRDVALHRDRVMREARPDMLMVQSWGEHPTWDDFLKPEDDPTGFLGIVADVIRAVGATPRSSR